MAAIDSTKLVQINQERELTAHEKRLQKKAASNPKNLNSGFAKIIKSQTGYEQKSAKYYQDRYNQQLQRKQAQKLKEFKKNQAKYGKKRNYKKNQDVNAGAESFYFTKSGQQSRFTNAKQKQYEDDMDDVLMGGCENDDDSKSDDTD